MTQYDVKRLALVLAIQAEIEGMKALNIDRQSAGDSNAFSDADFQCKADELRNMAYCDETQL